MSSESPDGKPHIVEKKREAGGTYKDYFPYLSLGIQLAVVMVLSFFLGDWIDRRYEIDPAGKLICAAIGLTGGFIKFFRSVAMLVKDEEKRQSNKKNES